MVVAHGIGLRARHLRHSARVHVVSAPILDHLFGQVNVDSLFMKERSQVSEQKRSSRQTRAAVGLAPPHICCNPARAARC